MESAATPSTDGLSPADRAFLAMVANPVAFCRRVLVDDLWAVQEAILTALAQPRARVAVKACHASGKTRCAADAVIWFLTSFPDGIVLTTAPTWIQVEKILWGEIAAAIERAQIDYPKPNRTELRFGARNFAVGLSTNEAVRFQGYHADHMLIVLDEAPGVRGEIYEAIEGARAGGDVRILALGNPTITGGPFYDAFTSHRDTWETFTIRAQDTPNLAGVDLEDLCSWAKDDPRLDVGARPYLTTRRWVWERWQEWGKHGHPLWEARVLGDFPAQAEDALLSLSWVEAAKLREAVDGGGALVAGIDVAGPGEAETVLVVRERGNLLCELAWTAPDPRGHVLAALAPYKHRIETVKVDVAGIGYYLAKHLEDAGFRVDYINVGQSPRDSERYRNHKAEAYWGLRLRFQEQDIAGALSEKMIKQLTTIRYAINARGQVEIESKEDARKRGVDSPDRAEALMLAYAEPVGDALNFLRYLEETVRERAGNGAGAPVSDVGSPVPVAIPAADAPELEARRARYEALEAHARRRAG